MPVHDWTRVTAGTFHDFDNTWITYLRDALNAGPLSEGFDALGEQASGGPDRLTLHAMEDGLECRPDMPLFLTAGHYVNVPLETTYMEAWRGVPQRWKRVIEDAGRSD